MGMHMHPGMDKTDRIELRVLNSLTAIGFLLYFLFISSWIVFFITLRRPEAILVTRVLVLYTDPGYGALVGLLGLISLPLVCINVCINVLSGRDYLRRGCFMAMLFIYGVTITIILILCRVNMVNKDGLSKHLTTTINRTTHPQHMKLWNELEAGYNVSAFDDDGLPKRGDCCGVNGLQDYLTTQPLNLSHVPRSCCKDISLCDSLRAEEDNSIFTFEDVSGTYFNANGCKTRIVDKYHQIDICFYTAIIPGVIIHILYPLGFCVYLYRTWRNSNAATLNELTSPKITLGTILPKDQRY